MFRKVLTVSRCHAAIGMARPVVWRRDASGFVQLKDVMPQPDNGSPLKCDTAVVEAARISYSNATSQRTPQQDARLIRYLMRHQHTSPFEMVEFKFHVRAPLFVLRQWYRHRTFSYNEVSARYTQVADVVSADNVFVPTDVRKQSDTNPQASVSADPNHHHHHHVNDRIVTAFFAARAQGLPAQRAYLDSLKLGVPREQARMVLPQNMMTDMIVKGNLKNWLHFVRLRSGSGAQHEIQTYANQIGDVIRTHCPATWDAYTRYQRDSITLSRHEVNAFGRALCGDTHSMPETHRLYDRCVEAVSHKGSKLAAGERHEFVQKLNTLFDTDRHSP